MVMIKNHHNQSAGYVFRGFLSILSLKVEKICRAGSDFSRDHIDRPIWKLRLQMVTWVTLWEAEMSIQHYSGKNIRLKQLVLRSFHVFTFCVTTHVHQRGRQTPVLRGAAVRRRTWAQTLVCCCLCKAD